VEAGARLNLHAHPSRPSVIVGFADWLTAPHVRGTRRWLATLTESTLVSEHWVELINAEAAGVLLPTESLCDVYRNSGVTVPLVNIGYAVEPVGDPVPLRVPGKPFSFLTYTYGDVRKGADMVITAFMALYKDNPDYELVIKAREGYDTTWMVTMANQPGIRVVGGQQSGESWADLLRESHCFVFPSRAEGIGLPPREATLMHIPTIATRWLGMDDVGAWGCALDVEKYEPCQYDDYEANREGALWAKPSWQQLKGWMNLIPKHYADAYALAVNGAAYLRGKTWQAVGEKILEAVCG
jgi:glycosyltransferase involved in cell wall biosynthesis